MSKAPILPLCSPEDGGSTLPLYVVEAGDEATISSLLGAHELFLKKQGFDGGAGDFTLLPGESGPVGAVFCTEPGKGPMPYGVLAEYLPEGDWTVTLRLKAEESEADETASEAARHSAAVLEELILGFCLGAYHYTLKNDGKNGGEQAEAGPRLCIPADPAGEARILARTAWLGRDLINSPANLLGPDELAEAARQMLEERGADVTLIRGEALEKNYPCLAAVGAGSDRAPVVVVGRKAGRSKDAPHLSLVGKGVCFDTGGYDIKPGSSMGKMKKDMGGATLMLALACALLEAGRDLALDIRLGCVENSVSGHAMRPGDVLRTRKGLSVEVGNTDAEGRLVLADLLTEAAESKPDILLDAATLTGAARVALGPDLPALFSNDDDLAGHILAAGRIVHDPLWQLPLWGEYDPWMDSSIADCNNLSSRPMAGAITAALFLQRFVPEGQKWAHIDTYGWNDTSRPGRPLGGEVLALRALFCAFSESF